MASVPMAGLLLTSAWFCGHAAEPSVEWRFHGGAQIDAQPAGVLDLGVRTSDVSLQLFTDTLDLRWSPEWDRGRAWVAGRAEYGAVGLLHAPWLDGAPAPERGFSGAYAGGEAGAVRYLPHGLYVGAAGSAYYTSFRSTPSTAVAVPEPTPWLGIDALAGWWSSHTHVWVRAGLQHDRLGAPVQPHAHLVATSAGDHRLGHLAELRAGTARGQSILTRTRVGGMNPYVVPVAGAGWAEWWAESYALARVGPRLKVESGGHTTTHALVADVGVVDDTVAAGTAPHQTIWGMGLLQRWDGPRWFVQADLGWAGGIPRVSGTPSWSGWLLVGRPWS